MAEMWACRNCGLHPNSRADWCDAGCGSDYNQMFLVKNIERYNERLLAAALWILPDSTLVHELNSRLVSCAHGHEPKIMALWPCYECAVERAIEPVKTALRWVEWEGVEWESDTITHPACPGCGWRKGRGHAPECLVGLALAKEAK
jgi:hypothetical protein